VFDLPVFAKSQPSARDRQLPLPEDTMLQPLAASRPHSPAPPLLVNSPATDPRSFAAHDSRNSGGEWGTGRGRGVGRGRGRGGQANGARERSPSELEVADVYCSMMEGGRRRGAGRGRSEKGQVKKGEGSSSDRFDEYI